MNESQSITICNRINPLMEALLHCNRHVKGVSITDEIFDMREQYPEQADEIDELFSPLIKLEGILNDIFVNVSPEKRRFYFDDLGDETKHHPRGYSIANALLMPMADERFDDISFLEYANKLSALPQNDMLMRMRLAFATRHLVYSDWDNVDINRFFDCISVFPASDGEKLRIFDAALHYKTYIEELYAMLQPLVDAVAQAESLYAPLTERFVELFSQMSVSQIDELIHGSEPEQNNNFLDANAYSIHPILFNLGRFYLERHQSDDDDSTHCSLDINILFDKTSQFKKRALPFKNIAGYIKALSDPTRLQIISMLRNDEVYVQELTERLGLSFTTVSHHMTKLMMADLVSCEKRGNCVYYKANQKGIRWLMERLYALLEK